MAMLSLKQDFPDIADEIVLAADSHADLKDALSDYKQACRRLSDHEHEHLSAGTRVTEFVLVPFLPQNPCSHALWDPNQVVYVNLLEPVLVEDPESPVWVVGTITLDNITTDDGLSAYRIVEAVTTEYEY